MNITLSIDKETVKKVRKIAIDRDTTLTAMVRGFLHSVADSDESARNEIVAKLMDSIARNRRPMGPRRWSRDDLHDR